jgi:hypothetical protein
MGHSIWLKQIPDIGTRAANQIDKHDECRNEGDPDG